MIWRDAGLMNEDQTNAELVSKLAALPLMFEPGTTWEYSMSTDVLGRVVEVVSGQGLAEFFAARITGPLGMADTAFEATGASAERLAEPQTDPATGARPPMRNVGRAASLGLGRRRAGFDRGRLPALLPDAAERRRARRHAAAGAEDGRGTWPRTICRPDAATARPRARGSARSPRCRRWATASASALRCAPARACRRCRARSANSSGAASPAPISGSTRPKQLVVVSCAQAPDQRLHYRYLSRQLVYAAITGPGAK